MKIAISGYPHNGWPFSLYLHTMICRFKIFIGSDVYDIPNSCIKNLDDIAFSLERKDFSGVTRSFTSDFEFVGKAYTMLRSLYEQEGVIANAELCVETINNDWTFTEQFRCALDFSTIQIDAYTLTISSVDNSLTSRINAKKSTKYQFNVSDLADEGLLKLKRITMTNTSSLLIGNPLFTDGVNVGDVINLRVDNDEIFTNEYFEITNQIGPQHEEGESINSFFVTGRKYGADLKLNLNITYRGYLCPRNLGAEWDFRDDMPTLVLQLWIDDGVGSGWSLYNVNVCQFRMHSEFIHGIYHDHMLGQYNTLAALKSAHPSAYEDDIAVVGAFPNPYDQGYWDSSALYVFKGGQWTLSPLGPSRYYKEYTINTSVTIPKEHLGVDYHVGLRFHSTTQNKAVVLPVYGSHVVAKWTDEAKDSVLVNVIKPIELANAIVNRIDDSASVEFDSPSELLNETYIVAGEAIRQLEGAQVFSTFKDFAEWMSVQFAMTYSIEGNVVKFLPLEKMFNDEVVKVIDISKDVNYSVDDSLIYSSVQAGQDLKEYSEINGRDQWFSNTYDTGISVKENILTLMCKYRSDSYGVELTARKIGKNTTDTTSDESIFFLHLKETGTATDDYKYEIARWSSAGTTNELYNFEYSAFHIIDVNKRFISAMHIPITLEWASSVGNSSIYVPLSADGSAYAKITDPITINERLFTAGVIEFTTCDVEIPSNWNGLVQVEGRDRRYTGYIRKVEAKYSRVEALSYTLIVKSIEAI